MSNLKEYGAGSIYKRKDRGSWVAQMYINGDRIARVFKTENEAIRWRAQQQILHRLHGGDLLTATRFGEYLNDWLAEKGKEILATSINSYRSLVKNYVPRSLLKKRLLDISNKDLKNVFFNVLDSAKEGLTNHRAHNVLHTILSQVFEDSKEFGGSPSSPMKGIKRQKAPKKELMVLSRVELEKLLKFIETKYWHNLVAVTAATGMRCGEALGLQWKDIDWDQKLLTIRRQAKNVKGKKGVQLIHSTKAHGSEIKMRRIELGPKILDYFQKQYEFVQSMKASAGQRWEENNLIFPSTVGTPKDPNNVSRKFTKYIKESALPKITFHGLRHTYATLSLEAGAMPKTVQERLGHADISTTLRIYAHVLPTMQQKAAEIADDLLPDVATERSSDESLPNCNQEEENDELP